MGLDSINILRNLRDTFYKTSSHKKVQQPARHAAVSNQCCSLAEQISSCSPWAVFSGYHSCSAFLAGFLHRMEFSLLLHHEQGCEHSSIFVTDMPHSWCNLAHFFFSFSLFETGSCSVGQATWIHSSPASTSARVTVCATTPNL